MKNLFSKFSIFNIILGGILLISGTAISVIYWRVVILALPAVLILFGIVRAVRSYNRWVIRKALHLPKPLARKGIRLSLANTVLTVMLVVSIVASIVHITFATAPNPGHNFSEVGGGILQGQILYGSAADTLSALPVSAVATNYLSNTGASNNPAWAQVNLTNGVTGTLPPGNGGTGVANGANNTIAFTGNYTLGVTLSGNTTLTFPTTGTVTALGNATVGSGSIVLATSPSLTTPTLGVASVTTINGLTPTSQSTGFTLAGGTTPATLTVTGNATISGTPLSNPMTTAGDVIYGGTGGVATRLPAGATTGMVFMNTAAGAPSWALLSSLPTTAGILPVANGGTSLGTLTTGNVILGAGTSAPTFVAPSTAGNLLESNGTTWVSATGGVLTSIKTINAGTVSYSPTAGTTNAIIELWGGGGSGGGCSAVAGCAGGGGGSGGYAMYYFTNMGAGPYTVSVGAAVAGTSGAAGTAGNNTTFSTGTITITAFGGKGGAFTAGTAAIKFMAGGAGGAVSTNGTINGAGAPGGNGMTGTTATVNMSGSGGSTSLGGGGVGITSATGAAGTTAIANTGSGGGGAAAGTATAGAGGGGAAGLIMIYEFR